MHWKWLVETDRFAKYYENQSIILPKSVRPCRLIFEEIFKRQNFWVWTFKLKLWNFVFYIQKVKTVQTVKTTVSVLTQEKSPSHIMSWDNKLAYWFLKIKNLTDWMVNTGHQIIYWRFIRYLSGQFCWHFFL